MDDLNNHKDDMDDDRDDVGDLQRTLTEPSFIVKPFTAPEDPTNKGAWNPKVDIPPLDRSRSFSWEKPQRAARPQLVESASRYQAIYLEKQLKQKERDMRLVVNQLIKVNAENVDLLKELEGYRGKKYDDLYKENIILRERVARASRENVMLAGQLRKVNNRKLTSSASRLTSTASRHSKKKTFTLNF